MQDSRNRSGGVLLSIEFHGANRVCTPPEPRSRAARLYEQDSIPDSSCDHPEIRRLRDTRETYASMMHRGYYIKYIYCGNKTCRGKCCVPYDYTSSNKHSTTSFFPSTNVLISQPRRARVLFNKNPGRIYIYIYICTIIARQDRPTL